MNIESLVLKNFRCFSDFSVNLDKKMTVFIGDNATGKTSILTSIGIAYFALYNILPNSQAIINFTTYDLPHFSPEMTSIEINTSTGKVHAVAPDAPAHIAHTQYFKLTKEMVLKNDSIVHSLISVIQAIRENSKDTIPIFKTYSLSRYTWEKPRADEQYISTEHPRLHSFSTAFAEHWRFFEFSAWFQKLENDFFSKVYKDKNYTSPVLSSVKDAVTTCLCEYEDIRTELFDNDSFIVLTEKKSGKVAFLHQLSSGYMSIVSIVADLACRMAKTNPYLDNPLESKGIVIIDEIDLSLHPRWQQRVLGDLQRVFPNIQFIVSTHSPLVLTTVHPENIVRLVRMEDGDIEAQYGKDLGISTYGADAMRLMRYFMDVFPRPAETKVLIDEYVALINQGKGKSARGREIRASLEQYMPDDPILQHTDDMIAHRERFS